MARRSLLAAAFLWLAAFSVPKYSRGAEEQAPASTPEAKPLPARARAAEVPDAQKIEGSSAAVAHMRDVLSRVLKHLEDARAERDVIKLNCVNEKLTAVKGLLRISEQADVSLQEAVGRKDNEQSQHEYVKITIAERKCEQLLAESEACIGEVAVYSGETQVDVVIEGVPDSDPTEWTGEQPYLTRPQAASPYQ
jgi:hypothetical protein